MMEALLSKLDPCTAVIVLILAMILHNGFFRDRILLKILAEGRKQNGKTEKAAPPSDESG